MKTKKASRCRKAAQWMSQDMDQALNWTEKLQLSLHLGLCTGCWSYGRQLQLMRSATQRWQSHTDDVTPKR
jgi:hypothetical protein